MCHGGAANAERTSSTFETAHEVILAAGLVSARTGLPLLLALIGVGMLAGGDGPGGIQFDDFRAAYLVGSLALAAIRFRGGLSTERGMIERALWPAVALATAGVVIGAGLVGAAVVLLRVSRIEVPSRVSAAPEVKSGLNDPTSVSPTVGLVEFLTMFEGMDAGHAALLFGEEMGGGTVTGLASGYALLRQFRWLDVERSVFPVFAVVGALATS